MGNSSRTKRRKKQQQCEAAKGSLTLHTFWDTMKLVDEVDDEQLDDEIEDYNWHNKIPAALKNLKLNIKKENVKNEVLVRLNGICLYLQLIKYNYSKMDASNIVADAAEKVVYYAKCIRF